MSNTTTAGDNALPVEESPDAAKDAPLKDKSAKETAPDDDGLSEEKAPSEKKALPAKDKPAEKIVSDDDKISDETAPDEEKDASLEDDSSEEALSDESGLEDGLSDDDMDESDFELPADFEPTLRVNHAYEFGLGNIYTDRSFQIAWSRVSIRSRKPSNISSPISFTGKPARLLRSIPIAG